MDASEILSAFVDGEPADPEELATALGEPGARETLIDFVHMRIAAAEDGQPSDAMVQRMRRRLGRGVSSRIPAWLRLAAAIVVGLLATVGALDLVRGTGLRQRPDEPPVATRVIRFEPGVDWKPAQGR